MRYWVYQALYEVIVNQVYSNLYLKNHLHEVKEKDQALATHIFYGTIQNYMYCQYIWKQYANKNVQDKVNIILSMSVYQICFLDKVPKYAIVNDAIEITKKVCPKASGLVNAILRKINPDCISLPEDECQALSIRYSIPLWLIQMWKKQYGMDATKQMVTHCNQDLPIFIRWNPDYEFDQNFEWVTHQLYKTRMQHIASSNIYLEGKCSIQDEGSYRICLFLDVKKNMNVLDCCAAPGTKSMAIAESLCHTGHVDCIEIHKHRKKLIEQDIKRLHLDNVSVYCQDARNLSNFGLYDRILCDVPCSGYGVLSRKPDIKLKMKPTDMDSLIPLQQQILESASSHLKKDGILVYSTCTINKKENEKQVQAFLKNHPEFICSSQVTMLIDEKQDGFYMAKIQYRN
ncbi:16S rRNA (cytosine(967)-C(5))-methyltransferase RsmB [Floccifex sp.]|uniref:16S rRNA (cytosine(967)-C(5))-methyltransferase RsmB n=1 Tax=Floccifex sp. TaxID=2815810 RepID=UPI003F1113F1